VPISLCVPERIVVSLRFKKVSSVNHCGHETQNFDFVMEGHNLEK
jgi:hypothetical protein